MVLEEHPMGHGERILLLGQRNTCCHTPWRSEGLSFERDVFIQKGSCTFISPPPPPAHSGPEGFFGSGSCIVLDGS